VRILLACLLLFALPARAESVWPGTDLYEGHTIVSGTTPATRGGAIVQAFRRVLVKVSGDPSLGDDPQADPFDAMAATMVEDFAYQDRLSDVPRHDEQGTRDRPFDFAAHFDRARVNAVLVLLGRRPYLAPRPPLVIRVTVEKDGHRFPMTADAADDEQQREALLAAAERFGMRVVLPDSTRITRPSADAVVLSGTLVWQAATFGWSGAWHLDAPGRSLPRDWTITGVSFDEAFRSAVGGSLAVLAGHAG
jgi:hypothetical protein